MIFCLSVSLSLSLSPPLSISQCLAFCFPFLRLIRPAFFLSPNITSFPKYEAHFSPWFPPALSLCLSMSCRFLNILDHVSNYIQRFLLRRRKTNFSSDTQLRRFSRMIRTPSLGRTAFDLLYVYNNKQLKRSRSLKMVPIGFPETSVRNYHYRLLNIAYERRF